MKIDERTLAEQKDGEDREKDYEGVPAIEARDTKAAAKAVVRLLALLPDDFGEVADGDDALELSCLSCALVGWASEHLSPEEDEAARETSQLIEAEPDREEGER